MSQAILNALLGGNQKTKLEAGAELIGSMSIDQTTPGTTNAVSLTGSMVVDESLKVKQTGIQEFTALSATMAATKDGTQITEIVASTETRTLLLLADFLEAIMWTRELPSTAFWNQATEVRTLGTKTLTKSNGTGYTGSGKALRLQFGSGGADSEGEWVIDIDFTNVSTMSFYSKQVSANAGCYLKVNIGTTQIFTNGAPSDTSHDWTLRSLDVSSYTGTQELKFIVKGLYTASDPDNYYSNLILEV